MSPRCSSADTPGSPNGLGAAYFLVQHKRQLGKKTITKVRVWKWDDSFIGTPNMLFYVEDVPPSTALGDDASKAKMKARRRAEQHVGSRVSEKSRDGKNIVHEHIFRAHI
jgi:hypothetical protein